MVDIDTSALERYGYVVLEGLLHRREIDEFETEIARFSAVQLHKLGIERRADEAFIDVFSRGGKYTSRIYKARWSDCSFSIAWPSALGPGSITPVS